MTFFQLVCIQLLLIVVSNQILANPTGSESSDLMIDTNRNLLPGHDYNYENLEQILSDLENHENFRQHHIFDRISKRRAQAKANLAGLWGVPTRFA